MIGALFVLVYLCITFFGLGPVLMADGTQAERIWTLVVVILLYALVTSVLVYWLRRKN
jgi:protein-S-isoprenylcysteine O-methyltransferase Ste14